MLYLIVTIIDTNIDGVMMCYYIIIVLFIYSYNTIIYYYILIYLYGEYNKECKITLNRVDRI